MSVRALSTGPGQLAGRDLATAREALVDEGTLILRGAVDVTAVAAAGTAVVRDFCDLSLETLGRHGIRVGERRYMVTPRFEPPFDRPELFASPPLVGLARALLGPAAVINSLAVVIALPGAPAQPVHVDHEPLFPRNGAASMGAPTYALTAIVPLIDLCESSGSTEVWPRGGAPAGPDAGDERLDTSTVLPLSAGDAAFIDYRVYHRGTANPGSVPRPILYIVYSRAWFRDADNFDEMPPIRVSRTQLGRVPSEYRTLFATVAAGHLE